MNLGSLPLVNKTGEAVPASRLQGKTVAFYFSAHWCPPCRGFTPLLRKFYESLPASENLEIVFVSGDRDEASFKEYFQNDHGNWLAVKYGSPEIAQLNKHCNVEGIPHLTVVDGKGECVVPGDQARKDVAGATSEASVLATFAQWKKAAGDWRESAGTALGGGSSAPANDAAAMRAARLARLGGGGGPAPAAPTPAPAAPAVAPVAADVAAPATATAEAAPAPSLALAADAEKVQQLQAMGFSEEQCRNGLAATNGNVEQALELLLAQAA